MKNFNRIVILLSFLTLSNVHWAAGVLIGGPCDAHNLCEHSFCHDGLCRQRGFVCTPSQPCADNFGDCDSHEDCVSRNCVFYTDYRPSQATGMSNGGDKNTDYCSIAGDQPLGASCKDGSASTACRPGLICHGQGTWDKVCKQPQGRCTTSEPCPDFVGHCRNGLDCMSGVCEMNSAVPTSNGDSPNNNYCIPEGRQTLGSRCGHR